MKASLNNVALPASLGLLLTLPLIVLELVNRGGFHKDFPIPLFVMLWALPLMFFFVVMPIARDVRAGHGSRLTRIGLVLRLAALLVIAFLWGELVRDQMPCFLGVPNCD